MGKTKIKPIEETPVEEKKIKRTSRGEVVNAGADQPMSELGEADQNAQALTSMTSDETMTEGQASLVVEHADNEPDSETTESTATKTKFTETTKSKPKKSKKQGKARVRGKKYQAAIEQLDRSQRYSLNEAIELVQKTSYSKFTGTVEAHINTHQALRGFVSLPFAAGKKITILAFGKDAKEAGADIIGDESTLEQISKGKINFDIVVATPDWMGKLATVAKVLGPRGLMPNPKSGTITDDLKKAISELQSGKTEYKTESKAKVIHLSVGKVDQDKEELTSNIKTLFMTIGKSRISKLTLSPTMGPGIKVDLGSI